MRELSLIVGFVFVSMISTAHAAGDMTKGAQLARDSCASCHNVEPGGPFKQYPPSFAAIAVYHSADQIHMRIIFPPQHSSMPQLAQIVYNVDNVEDLVAYITSLEQQ